MEYRQRLLPATPARLFLSSPGRGKRVPAASRARERQAGKSSSAAGAGQGWGTKRGAGGREFSKSRPCSSSVSRKWIQAMFSRLWWFPPGADSVDHVTVAAAPSENWPEGQPTALPAAQGLQLRSATEHLHLWSKPHSSVLFNSFGCFGDSP